MKNNMILQIVIVILVCLLAVVGYFAYRDQISVLQSGSNNSIAILNGQITSLQSQNAILQSQNLALNSQANQFMMERDKAKNLKTFASVEELRSFVANNAGYNFGSNVYDNSDVCVKIMLAAKNQGYWMGLMPKQTVSYVNDVPWNDYSYNTFNNCNNCNNCNDCSYFHSSSFFYNNSYRYNYYSSPSFSGVVNVAVVGGRDLYAIESGTVLYVGSMSATF